MSKILKRILLVDDSEDDNYLHRRVLEKMEIAEQIDEVYDGEEALEYLTNTGKFASREIYPQPELIFLDINMPRMNGWEFLESYKQLDQQVKGKIVVVMLTTSQNPNEVKKAIDVEDVKDFMTKPLTISMVEKVLKEFFLSS